LNKVGESADGYSADDDGARSSNDEDGVTFGIAEGHGRDDEEQQTRQQDEDYRQERFDLPIDANRVQIENLNRLSAKSRDPALRAG
jgi:hypothetical protein